MHADGDASNRSEVFIIGSGFSGLATAVALQNAGLHDFVIAERGDTVGGTWRDNTYPGAACDVPSQLYSFSFERNKTWTRSFSKQAEIHAYIEGVADRYGLRDRHRFGCEVLSARWHPADGEWEIETSQGQFLARFLVSGAGFLCEPRLPDIKGIANFAGQLFHTARWDHSADLRGKRVGVIGTGASAIQVIPAIAPEVEHLDVYQRSGAWVMPRADRPYTLAERLAYKYLPGASLVARAGIYWWRELWALGMTQLPQALVSAELISRAMLRAQIPDAQLREKVTPSYPFGSKRILLSNDYWPTLNRDNVDVVTAAITEVKPAGIVTADGTLHKLDAIVVATGFQVADSPLFEMIYGDDGRSLAEKWKENGNNAYKGTTVHGFPNLFLLCGPNTNQSHTSTVVMIEAQVTYLIDALRKLKAAGHTEFNVRPEVQGEFNARVQQQLVRTIWNTGQHQGWYFDAHGKNTVQWPGFAFQFIWQTRTFDIDAYDVKG